MTEPLAANTAFRRARPSIDVSGRGPSSMSTIRLFVTTSPEARSGVRENTSTGTISSLNSPAAMALSAFWCEASANASWSSRETFQRSATFSAVRPMP